jgi:hypothetical protein
MSRKGLAKEDRRGKKAKTEEDWRLFDSWLFFAVFYIPPAIS